MPLYPIFPADLFEGLVHCPHGGPRAGQLAVYALPRDVSGNDRVSMKEGRPDLPGPGVQVLVPLVLVDERAVDVLRAEDPAESLVDLPEVFVRLSRLLDRLREEMKKEESGNA